MKARLYRAKGKEGDLIDGYTLYFPFPKWYREQNGRNAAGTFLACSPGSDGTMTRCYWEDWEYRKYGRYVTGNGIGNKVDIATMPGPFRKEVERMQALWDEACAKRDFTRWNKEA